MTDRRLTARFSFCRPKGSQAVGGRRTATRTAHRTAQCQGPAPPRSRRYGSQPQSGRRSATSGACRTGPSAPSASACSRPGASLGTPSRNRQPQCTAGRRTSLGSSGVLCGSSIKLSPSHIRTHTPRSASRRCCEASDRSSQHPPLPDFESECNP